MFFQGLLLDDNYAVEGLVGLAEFHCTAKVLLIHLIVTTARLDNVENCIQTSLAKFLVSLCRTCCAVSSTVNLEYAILVGCHRSLNKVLDAVLLSVGKSALAEWEVNCEWSWSVLGVARNVNGLAIAHLCLLGFEVVSKLLVLCVDIVQSFAQILDLVVERSNVNRSVSP